jgi:hypothetical protein
VGWQFHPEVTARRFSLWVDRLRPYCRRHGADPEELLASAPGHEPRLRRNAYALVDATLGRLGATPSRPSLEVPR